MNKANDDINQFGLSKSVFLRISNDERGVRFEALESAEHEYALIPLGVKKITIDQLEVYTGELMEAAEMLNLTSQKDDQFESAIVAFEIAAMTYSERILTTEASAYLYESLATPSSTVRFLISDELKWVPWELCFLHDDPQEGFLNGLGTCERVITRPVKRGKKGARRNSGENMIILDEGLCEDVKTIETFKAANIDHTVYDGKGDCGKRMSRCRSGVYLGHFDADSFGLALNKNTTFNEAFLRRFPIESAGLWILSACNPGSLHLADKEIRNKPGKLRNLLMSHPAISMGDKCGCDVIYCLVELPYSIGRKIAIASYEALSSGNQYTTVSEVWNAVRAVVNSKYTEFFAIHGSWSATMEVKTK